jgi:molybdate transport system ATP-binding protein
MDTETKVDRLPQQRAIGIVFQDYVLFPHLTVFENITIAMQHLSQEQRRTRSLQLLETVNLGGLEQRRPRQLSGGQKQRVALARALARNPAVLLLDEPFSSVDQSTRRKLQRELAALRKQMRHPIIMVTHDVEEACLLADRICLLHHGRSLDIGTPDEILNQPKNRLAAQLVDLTNIFKGKILEHNSSTGTIRLRWLDYTLETSHRPGLAVGETVDWVIPAHHVLLHQRVKPSRGERENPIHGVIAELVTLGDSTSITLLVNGVNNTPITFSLPMHVVQRNNLAPGEEISVTLKASGIHLMPAHSADANAVI